MKKYHDQKIEKRDFLVGDLVFLFNSRLRFFFGTNSSLMEWSLFGNIFPHGAVELESKEGSRFTVNGQRIKIYLGHAENKNEVAEAYRLYKV